MILLGKGADSWLTAWSQYPHWFTDWSNLADNDRRLVRLGILQHRIVAVDRAGYQDEDHVRPKLCVRFEP